MTFDWRPKWTDAVGLLGILGVIAWMVWAVGNSPRP